MNPEKNYTYDAFISYRHTEPDKAVAERLHRLLETFKIPKSIVKATGKKKYGGSSEIETNYYLI
ncbi:MAG: hypothetical protein ACOYIF_11765 [Acetivibrionales bacterium]|jgi:hypothetical protein